MKLLTRPALFASFFILQSIILASAQTPVSQVDNVLFKAPEGWRRSEQNGAIIFVSPDSPADRNLCSLTIFPGQELEGDFRAWFDAKMKKEKEGLQIIGGDGVSSTKLKEGYPVLWSIFIAKDSQGNLSYHFYLAAQPGSRVEMISYIAKTQDAYNSNRRVLESFIDSLDFANNRKQELASPGTE
jgi:hypothetical protein